jgi:hypothetical protein
VVSSAPCRPRSKSRALAEGRLTDVQRFGRVAEVPQLSDGQEGTQEFEFHSKR